MMSLVGFTHPVSTEYIGYKRDEEGGWEGNNKDVGVQAAPVEVHATVGYTWLYFAKAVEPQTSLSTDSTVSFPIEYDNSNSQDSLDWEYWWYGWWPW